MTFKLKEWIANASTTLELLHHITYVSAVSMGGNSDTDVPLSKSDKVILIGIGSGNAKFVGLVNVDSGGSVGNLKVAGATNMTMTNGSGKVTVHNGYGGTMSVLIIKYKVHI